jgi:hypothetical protein
MMDNGPDTADIVRSERQGRDQDPVDGVVATVVGCLYVPGGTTESTDDRQQTVEVGSLFAPPGAPVPKPTDKIRIRGREGTYTCVGRADVWGDLDGIGCGYEQRLERVVG